MRVHFHSLALLFFLLTLISAASSSLTLAGGASAPLMIGATVVAKCDLSVRETRLNQNNLAKFAASVSVLCPQTISPMVHVSAGSSDRPASQMGLSSGQGNPLTIPEGSYSGNMTITVNF
jgi:hypothetical protein